MDIKYRLLFLFILDILFFSLSFSVMMAVLGIILFFIVPIYFILDNFDLRQDEKLIFSFFLGVGIFPSITYWIGLFISFRLSIIIAFVVLIVVGFVVRKYTQIK